MGNPHQVVMYHISEENVIHGETCIGNCELTVLSIKSRKPGISLPGFLVFLEFRSL